MSTTTTTADSTSSEPYVVEDCRGMLKVMSDGTIIRSHGSISAVPLEDAKYPSITWEDLTFDPIHNLQLRLYKPGSQPNPTTIILFFHGGGFCIGSRAMPSCHNFCLKLAAEVGAVVASVDYRLAPENRLPAAIEDGWTALKWVKTIYSQGQGVFVFGDSAGGTIAHHLAVRVASDCSNELEPVAVKGFILLEPGFTGIERTKSELEGPADTFLSLDALDRYGRLALPIGETSDCPLVNPFGPGGPNIEQLDLAPMLVMVGDRDILIDRIKDYASRLSKSGKKVDYFEFQGLAHAFLVTSSDPEPVCRLVSLTKRFISENSS